MANQDYSKIVRMLSSEDAIRINRALGRIEAMAMPFEKTPLGIALIASVELIDSVVNPEVPSDVSDISAGDAVEVVRCKDCKWRNTTACPYTLFKAAKREDNDFCSDGEKR